MSVVHAAETITIVYLDDSLIVIDKPAGLLSVPGRGPEKADCAAARVSARYRDALIVHRLDMATSGLMLMARGKAMQRALSGLFETGKISKTYIADVAGRPHDTQGEIDLPLIADWPNRPLQKVDFEIGKPSRTLWRVLASDEMTSRLELTPLTGRSHQLRVHLAAIGHAILGDEFYAPPDIHARAPRLHLHAVRLAFTHPDTGQVINVQAACPF